uniref:Reverse transcriptase domain-containing protein n=1 Tax=Strongyloides venezuelensis TaxID=75913 RepID=A0A0K0FCV1_STRVS
MPLYDLYPKSFLRGTVPKETPVLYRCKKSQKRYGTAKGRESKVPQLTSGIKDSIDGSEKLPTVKNFSTNGKKDLTKESQKRVDKGNVRWSGANLINQPRHARGPTSNKQIKQRKIVGREVVNIPSRRRPVPNVGIIKACESNQHDSMVRMLTSKSWELIEFNAFAEGQQPLFMNVSTKMLIINLRTLCMNMKFVACKMIKFLWWNSIPAGKSIKNCKCKFRTVMKKQSKPYVFKCSTSRMGGPATLAYADLPDI